MQEYDVEYVLQKTIKKYANVKPRIISDNGSQFVFNDFIYYLQSNSKIERFNKTLFGECLI
jgi:transposase InsO family protein